MIAEDYETTAIIDVIKSAVARMDNDFQKNRNGMKKSSTEPVFSAEQLSENIH